MTAFAVGLQNGKWDCQESHGPNKEAAEWCEHIKYLIESGDDAEMYHLGQTLIVPIFPSNDIWTTVVIDKEPVVARSALMHMEYQPDIGNLRKVPMGLWNPGEGMISMRTVIIDFIKSNLHPDENLTKGKFKTPCPNNAHSLRSSRILSEHCNEPGWKWLCLWNMVMERACTACIKEAAGDDNFGVDQSVVAKPRWA